MLIFQYIGPLRDERMQWKMNDDVLIFSRTQDRWKFIWNPNLFSPFWENSSCESRRRFESGWVMNNASTQRALPLSVRSQAGWANTGQHLQHEPGERGAASIKAGKPDTSQLASRPVHVRRSTWEPSKRLICWRRLIYVQPLLFC